MIASKVFERTIAVDHLIYQVAYGLANVFAIAGLPRSSLSVVLSSLLALSVSSSIFQMCLLCTRSVRVL